MTEVYLSIGSNMGNRLANLRKAIQMLNVPPKIDTTVISSVYETEPVGGVKQDSFYNIAVKVTTELTAQQLPNHLHNIEQELHRHRLIHWGSRIIDLDIIDFGRQHVKTSTLTISHPEMASWQFVLLPVHKIINQNDPYYQQLNHLLSETPDHNWLEKMYGREVLSWTNRE